MFAYNLLKCVINFLLSEPSSINNTKSIENCAVKSVSKLLKAQEYKMSSQERALSEVIIHDYDGNRATLLINESGEFLFLYNDTTVTISNEILLAAKKVYSNDKVTYNRNFNDAVSKTNGTVYSIIKIQKQGGEYFSEICQRLRNCLNLVLRNYYREFLARLRHF